MSEISKAYEPQAVEEKWYEFWLKQGCFTADPARVSAQRPAYSIVIPPPNVTGVLTMGHVLNNTIQDILARKARMDGKEVLWLPGTDHAGIATQNVVEKTLRKDGVIKHRDDLGREALVARIWEWKEKYGGIIIQQLKKLGASCDWSRERFTMDAKYSDCVQRVFVDLYKKGLIYRGKRMVNWCPVSQTALSDEEVTMKEQKGFLYYFRVQVVERDGTPVKADSFKDKDSGHPMARPNSPEPREDDQKAPKYFPQVDADGNIWLTIATTRPETIPGDTAVAVNPKDPRYGRFIGKYIKRPLPVENQSPLPVIGDEHIDIEFGTGVLKVTPAHDKADYEIFLRITEWARTASSTSPFMWALANMEPIEVIDAKGFMTEAAGAHLNGLERFKARKVAVEKLAELAFLEKEEPYTNNVGFSERADVPIEPRLSEQWFLKYPSVEKSRASVADGDMKFYPDRWSKVYDHWLGGIQDWCISRQLWWGHRVPVWYRGEEVYCGVEAPQGDGWTQDPDVLDTWFSSWLWPFATMGWPDKTEDLKKFYPTTDLVTGPDIIFFWVARMIMAGYEYMGDLPFKNVYFTGIIRDKNGHKMSKSLGNSPDPLALIGGYGADAVRFGVMRSIPLGQDLIFEDREFEKYKKEERYDFANIPWNNERFPQLELARNFCNKLWNACRFRQMQGGATETEITPELLTSDDRWILARLDQAIREVTQAFTDYRFNDATSTLYRFFWSEYCDWYVEASKAAFFGTDAKLKANKLAVIDFVLSNQLRLFHPFMPFITEELWHGMGYSQDLPEDRGGKTLMSATWPKPFSDEEKKYFGLDESADKVAAAKYELVSMGRNLRRELKLDPAKKLKFVLKPAENLPATEVEVLRLLLNAETIEVNTAYEPPKGTPSAGNVLGELYLPTAGLIDFGAERERLTKELEKVRAEIGKVQEKLGNPNFAQKVPAKVMEEHQQRLVDWQAKEKQLQSSLENLPQ